MRGAYGVRGWIKIDPYSTESDVLLQAKEWWLRHRHDDAVQRVQVRAVRPHSATYIAQVEGIQTREEAAELRGSRVLVPRSQFPPLEDGEYYWVDLIGCSVFSVEDTVAPEAAGTEASGEGLKGGDSLPLGRVVQVSDNGAHAVLHVQRTSAENTEKTQTSSAEILIPFVSAHILDVDLAARRIDTNWPADF